MGIRLARGYAHVSCHKISDLTCKSQASCGHATRGLRPRRDLDGSSQEVNGLEDRRGNWLLQGRMLKDQIGMYKHQDP